MRRVKPRLNNLKKLRRKEDITLKEMGEIIGKHTSTYHKKECGHAPFTLQEARKLARHFDTSIDALFYSRYYGKIKTTSQREIGFFLNK